VRIALDTNILAYAEGVNGEQRQAEALAILAPLEDEEVVIPVQVLGELFHVLVRKARRDARTAHGIVAFWGSRAELAETTTTVLDAALELAATHRLAVWDAVILAAAAEAGCDTLLTEDLNPGFTWRGCVVRNPFSPG
jgi:predicted nucleic acid-binding protein